jgi:hypothetical protein
MSDYDFPLFVDGVILVIKNPCKDIPEYRERFFERHTMPGQVGCCLSRVILSA